MTVSSTNRKAPEGAVPVAEPAKTFGTGKFTFTVSKVASIPEEVKAQPKRPQEMFFKEWFETATHADHIFIPNGYWTAPKEEGGRGVTLEPEKVTAYARQKVRDQFNTWRDKTKPAEGAPEGTTNPRDVYRLSVFPRKAGDRMDDASPPFPEDGLSLFFVDNGRV